MGKYVKKDLKKLLSKLKSDSEGGGKKEKGPSNYWKPALAKDEEKSEFLVRIMPNKDTDFPWIDLKTHMFKFPNTQYVSINCPQRHKIEDKKTGKVAKCPICSVVNEIYDSEDTRKIKTIASDRRAKPRYICNVLVLKDPRDGGANEGKIFQWSFGKQVYEIMLDNMEEEDYYFFDPEEGADLKIKMNWTGTGDNKYPEYTKSRFVNDNSVITIDGEELDEEKLDELVEKTFELHKEHLAEEKFFSVEKIEAIYANQGFKDLDFREEDEVAPTKKKPAPEVDEDEDEDDEPTPPPKKTKKSKPKVEEPEEDDEEDPIPDDDDDSDDDLDDILNGL